jgi:hypothetical protein
MCNFKNKCTALIQSELNNFFIYCILLYIISSKDFLPCTHAYRLLYEGRGDTSLSFVGRYHGSDKLISPRPDYDNLFIIHSCAFIKVRIYFKNNHCPNATIIKKQTLYSGRSLSVFALYYNFFSSIEQ